VDAYTFKGVLKDEVLGIEIEMPLEFTIVLAPDADEDLLYDASRVVVYALADKMKEEHSVGTDGSLIEEED
jgi:hypothetical protein